MTKPTDGVWIFDFDNHYYESEDAFTRHADPTLRNRGVRWADIDGKRRLLVGGTINSYLANPRFDPVAKPGALYEWYRGNPRQQQLTEAFGELEPIRPEYRDREARRQVMEEQGLAATLLFPTLGVGIEDALRTTPTRAPRPSTPSTCGSTRIGATATRTRCSPSRTSRCSIRPPPPPNFSPCSTPGPWW